jgi:hypothetical protein
MKHSTNVGTCRLCLSNHVALQKSHFIPAGLYRILREPKLKNPNPWVLSPMGAIQTSSQRTARLLCANCEQRLSAQGERWVLGNCLRADRTFPLATALAQVKPDVFDPDSPTMLYYAANIRAVNVAALSFFAASMFWRGSIHPWRSDGTIPVDLGNNGESFRKYLAGGAPFPEDCTLTVAIRLGDELDKLTYEPIGEARGEFHVCKFPMPGFAFSMMIGKSVPMSFRKFCFVRGHGNPIAVTTLIESSISEDARKMLERAPTPTKPVDQ